MSSRLLLGFLLVASLAPTPLLAVDCVCLIDEDCIDNGALAIEELANAGACGGGLPSVCVNDQLANPGVRTPLPLAPGTIIGNAFWPAQGTQAPLRSGQLFDEGLFKLCVAPQSWGNAGPTTDGLHNYLVAEVPGFGVGGEFLLDNILDVTPLHTADLEAMIGHSCCAIVYDSDISMNYDPLQGNLQGANLGILHFTILAVGPDPAGSVLPDITIRVEDPGLCTDVSTAVEERPWAAVKHIFR